MNEFLELLEKRFSENMQRHPNVSWSFVKERLLNNPDKLKVLFELDSTGEVDVVLYDSINDKIVFFDCSKESPNRRSLCYDDEALFSRKKDRPLGSAVGFCDKLGVSLLTESEYLYLQTLGEFDLKTSSWLKTEESVRLKGGAIFGDRRYNRTFIYHNGADSYYSARGFRVSISI